MSKKNYKENKGITLIALVITIIVLLILAGVAIATLTGENGIIQNAKSAKTETENKQAEEEAILIYDEYQIYKKMKESEGKNPTIEDFLNKYPENIKNDDGTYTITTDSGNKVKIDGSGNLIVNDNVISAKNPENVIISGETSVNIGKSITLTATMNAEDVKYKSIEWASSDTSKVTVIGNDKTCTVIGVSSGSVIITCKVINYNNTTISKEYEINVEYPTLASQAKVGDFVNYDAGNWNSTASTPSQTKANNAAIGPYTSGQSKNTSCVGNASGWRVLSISGETVTIVHAGCPTKIYHYWYAIKSGTYGKDCINAMNTFCTNNFINSSYATSARPANINDVGALATCGSRYIGCKYALASSDDEADLASQTENEMWYFQGAFLEGFRPIVTLKASIKTTGQSSNGYGNNGWNLVTL